MGSFCSSDVDSYKKNNDLRDRYEIFFVRPRRQEEEEEEDHPIESIVGWVCLRPDNMWVPVVRSSTGTYEVLTVRSVHLKFLHLRMGDLTTLSQKSGFEIFNIQYYLNIITTEVNTGLTSCLFISTLFYEKFFFYGNRNMRFYLWDSNSWDKSQVKRGCRNSAP